MRLPTQQRTLSSDSSAPSVVVRSSVLRVRRVRALAASQRCARPARGQSQPASQPERQHQLPHLLRVAVQSSPGERQLHRHRHGHPTPTPSRKRKTPFPMQSRPMPASARKRGGSGAATALISDPPTSSSRLRARRGVVWALGPSARARHAPATFGQSSSGAHAVARADAGPWPSHLD